MVVHRPSLPEPKDLDWLVLATTLAVFVLLSWLTGWPAYVCLALSLLPGWLLAALIRRLRSR